MTRGGAGAAFGVTRPERGSRALVPGRSTASEPEALQSSPLLLGLTKMGQKGGQKRSRILPFLTIDRVWRYAWGANEGEVNDPKMGQKSYQKGG